MGASDPAKRRAKYARLIEEKRCPRCGAGLLPEWDYGRLCPECWAETRAQRWDRRVARRKHALDYYHRHSTTLRPKLAGNKRARYLERKLAGLCTQCAAPLPKDHPVLTCASCRARQNSRSAAHQRAKRAGATKRLPSPLDPDKCSGTDGVLLDSADKRGPR